MKTIIFTYLVMTMCCVLVSVHVCYVTREHKFVQIIVNLMVNKLNLIEVRNLTSRDHNYFEFHAPLSILIKHTH